jgi:hypothetical protein
MRDQSHKNTVRPEVSKGLCIVSLSKGFDKLSPNGFCALERNRRFRRCRLRLNHRADDATAPSVVGRGVPRRRHNNHATMDKLSRFHPTPLMKAAW